MAICFLTTLTNDVRWWLRKSGFVKLGENGISLLVNVKLRGGDGDALCLPPIAVPGAEIFCQIERFATYGSAVMFRPAGKSAAGHFLAVSRIPCFLRD